MSWDLEGDQTRVFSGATLLQVERAAQEEEQHLFQHYLEPHAQISLWSSID